MYAYYYDDYAYVGNDDADYDLHAAAADDGGDDYEFNDNANDTDNADVFIDD
jgi:hypothetical protein